MSSSTTAGASSNSNNNNKKKPALLLRKKGLYVKRHKVRKRIFDLSERGRSDAYIEEQTEWSTKKIANLTQKIIGRVNDREHLNIKARDEHTKRSIAQYRKTVEKVDQTVDEFIRADHLLQPRHVKEYNDLNLEAKLYQQAREEISKQHEVMNDLEEWGVGEVKLPVRTMEDMKREERSTRYISEMTAISNEIKKIEKESKRSKNFLEQSDVRVAESKELSAQLADIDSNLSFEDKVKMRKRILVLRSEAEEYLADHISAKRNISELKEILDERQKLAQLTEQERHEMNQNKILLQQQRQLENDNDNIEGESNNSPKKELMKNEEEEDNRIITWILGKCNSDGICEEAYYGSFATTDEPPSLGWYSFHDHMKATIKVSTNLKIKASTFRNKGTMKKWYVEYSENEKVNGIFVENGKSDMVFKFANNHNVTLFRAKWPEIPSLGITKQTCNGITNEDGSLNANAKAFLTKEAVPDDPMELKEFRTMYSAGLKMVTLDTIDISFRRQQLKATVEQRQEAKFNKIMKMASKRLHAINSSDPTLRGDENSIIAALAEDDKTNIASLIIPNTTFQYTAESEMGAEANRIISSNEFQAAPLCKPWALLQCTKTGSKCVRRHYYCNEKERDHWVDLRQQHDIKLELDILRNITNREILLKEIQQETTKLSRNFLYDTDTKLTFQDCEVLLRLLDRMRYFTLKCTETIHAWMEHVKTTKMIHFKEKYGQGEDKESLEEQSDMMRKIPRKKWSVCIAVDGPTLYEASPAFPSRFKRYQRKREEPKRAQKIVYVGLYKSKVEAAHAFDRANIQQAIKQNTTVNRMPGKKFVLRSCGNHYAVESVTMPRRACEQCASSQYGGGIEFVPTYLWNGENYLLKLLTDLDFLDDFTTIQEIIGEGFQFENNPLLLAPTILNDKGTLLASSDNIKSHPEKLQFVHGRRPSNQITHENNFENPQGEINFESSISASSIPGGISIDEQDLRPLTSLYEENRWGTPSTTVVKLLANKQNVLQWRGVTVVGSRFLIDYSDDLSNVDSEDIITHIRKEKKAENEKESVVEVIDLVRIRDALEVLDLQKELYELMLMHQAKKGTKVDLSRGFKIDDVNKELARKKARKRSRENQKPKLIEKIAVYRWKGACLNIIQPRKPLAYRQPLVWCRADKGEWKGLRSNGPAMRSFEFKKKLTIQGRKKATALKYLTRLLRLEYRKDITQVSIPRLKELIEKAEIAGKGTLLMQSEINKARKCLFVFEMKDKVARFLQRWHRGNMGRIRAKERSDLLEEAETWRIKHEIKCGELAEGFMSNVIKKCIKDVSLEFVKPQFNSGCLLETDTYIVSLVSLEHSDFMHKSLYPPDNMICAAHRKSDPRMIFSAKDQTYKISFPPCTCIRERIPERFFMKIYDPIDCSTYLRVLTEQVIRDKLIKAKEAGQLPFMSAELLSHLKLEDYKEKDQLLDYMTKSDRDLSILGNITNSCKPAGIPVLFRDRWEPMREIRLLQGKIKTAEIALKSIEGRYETQKKIEMETFKNVNILRLAKERVEMAYEDSREKFLVEVDKWDHAMKITADAVKWTKLSQIRFDQYLEEDWTQVWDPLENANDWQMLRKRREYARNIVKTRNISIQARKDMFNAVMDYKAMLIKKERETHKRETLARQVDSLKKLVKKVKRLEKELNELLEECIKQLLQVMVFRNEPSVPSKHSMLFKEISWYKMKDPKKRVGWEFRKAWNFLLRRTLRVSWINLDPTQSLEVKELSRFFEGARYIPAHRMVGAPLSKRLITTILQDPVTGWLRIVVFEDGGGFTRVLMISPHDLRNIIKQYRSSLLEPTVLVHGGFIEERQLRARKKQEVCELILQNLKLDPHRDDITVGNMLLMRKCKELDALIKKTVWYRDKKSKKTILKGTEVFREVRVVGNRWLLCIVYENWGDLLVEAYSPSDCDVYYQNIPFIKIVQALKGKDNLELFQAFLLCVRLNKYGAKIIREVLDKLDFILPGENQRWWRRQLVREYPRLTFVSDKLKRFRGRVYNTSYYINGKAVEIHMYQSLRGDYRVIVSKGLHGPKYCRYDGEDLVLEIDHLALRKICIDDLGRLDPDRKLELHRYIIDKLKFSNQAHIKSKRKKNKLKLAGHYLSTRKFSEWIKKSNAPIAKNLIDDPANWYNDLMDELTGAGKLNSLKLVGAIDKDDHLPLVHSEHWSIGDDLDFSANMKSVQHFTARICIMVEDTEAILSNTVKKNLCGFSLSLREPTPLEVEKRNQLVDHKRMEIEDKNSRKAWKVHKELMFQDQVEIEQLLKEAQYAEIVSSITNKFRQMNNRIQRISVVRDSFKRNQQIASLTHAKDLVSILVNFLAFETIQQGRKKVIRLNLNIPGKQKWQSNFLIRNPPTNITPLGAKFFLRKRHGFAERARQRKYMHPKNHVFHNLSWDKPADSKNVKLLYSGFRNIDGSFYLIHVEHHILQSLIIWSAYESRTSKSYYLYSSSLGIPYGKELRSMKYFLQHTQPDAFISDSDFDADHPIDADDKEISNSCDLLRLKSLSKYIVDDALTTAKMKVDLCHEWKKAQSSMNDVLHMRVLVDSVTKKRAAAGRKVIQMGKMAIFKKIKEEVVEVKPEFDEETLRRMRNARLYAQDYTSIWLEPGYKEADATAKRLLPYLIKTCFMRGKEIHKTWDKKWDALIELQTIVESCDKKYRVDKYEKENFQDEIFTGSFDPKMFDYPPLWLIWRRMIQLHINSCRISHSNCKVPLCTLLREEGILYAWNRMDDDTEEEKKDLEKFARMKVTAGGDFEKKFFHQRRLQQIERENKFSRDYVDSCIEERIENYYADLVAKRPIIVKDEIEEPDSDDDTGNRSAACPRCLRDVIEDVQKAIHKTRKKEKEENMTLHESLDKERLDILQMSAPDRSSLKEALFEAGDDAINLESDIKISSSKELDSTRREDTLLEESKSSVSPRDQAVDTTKSSLSPSDQTTVVTSSVEENSSLDIVSKADSSLVNANEPTEQKAETLFRLELMRDMVCMFVTAKNKENGQDIRGELIGASPTIIKDDLWHGNETFYKWILSRIKLEKHIDLDMSVAKQLMKIDDKDYKKGEDKESNFNIRGILSFDVRFLSRAVVMQNEYYIFTFSITDGSRRMETKDGLVISAVNPENSLQLRLYIEKTRLKKIYARSFPEEIPEAERVGDHVLMVKYFSKNITSLVDVKSQGSRKFLTLKEDATHWERWLAEKEKKKRKIAAEIEARKVKENEMLLRCKKISIRSFRENAYDNTLKKRREMIIASSKEWPMMMAEDTVGHRLRPYLTLEGKKLNKMEEHFKRNDINNDGLMNQMEFYQFMKDSKVLFEVEDPESIQDERKREKAEVKIEGQKIWCKKEFLMIARVNGNRYRSGFYPRCDCIRKKLQPPHYKVNRCKNCLKNITNFEEGVVLFYQMVLWHTNIYWIPEVIQARVNSDYTRGVLPEKNLINFESEKKGLKLITKKWNMKNKVDSKATKVNHDWNTILLDRHQADIQKDTGELAENNRQTFADSQRIKKVDVKKENLILEGESESEESNVDAA